MKRFLIATLLAGTTALPATAEDLALIVGNDRYEIFDRVRDAGAVSGLESRLEEQGFRVIALSDVGMPALTEALRDFGENAGEADRLLVALAGRYTTDGDRSWFMAAFPENVDLLTVGGQGVSLESLMKVLGTAQGRAVLALGDDGTEGEIDDHLRLGIGDLEAAQGVTVLRGDPARLARFLDREVLRPGGDVAEAVADDRRIAASGYLPKGWSLVAEAQAAAAPETPAKRPEPVIVESTAAEDAVWQSARRIDSEASYRDYLRQYPEGRFRAEARKAIEDIRAEPDREARLAEEALALPRDARREIQRDLTILDYNTRGIDGIFGPGTRQAITNWQQQNGYAQTSYLDREQVRRLDDQAKRRAAELEAEAARRREAESRADRAYWQDTGAAGDEAGLRSYLERYPDGEFSDLAKERLEGIELEKRTAAEERDRELWDRARRADNIAAYRSYLEERPDGAFKAEAQARIAALDRNDGDRAAQARAEAAEAALNLNPITRRLAEAKLADLGLEPGPVDGQFDADTRRALRRYQQARNIPATGYLNEATVVRLLADSIGLE